MIPRLLPVLLPVLLLPVLLATVACGTATHVEKRTERKATRTVQKRQIHSMETVNIGGLPQQLYIRGLKAGLPVLLFLHGGPGYPEAGRAHRYGADLEEEFIMVHWDQRGAGRSYSSTLSPADMSIAQLTADTIELTEYLTSRFGVERIVLVAHSFGTTMGLLAAKKRPELYWAYVGMGQIVNLHLSEQISYKWALETATAQEKFDAVKQLRAIGQPPYGDTVGDYMRGMSVHLRWITRLGGSIYGEANLKKVTQLARTAYRGWRVQPKQITAGVQFSFKTLWKDARSLDMFTAASEIKVPLFLVSGRLDYTTPFELVKRYQNAVVAPSGKHMVWFYNSAHWPHIEEPDKFARLLIDRVLPLVGR